MLLSLRSLISRCRRSLVAGALLSIVPLSATASHAASVIHIQSTGSQNNTGVSFLATLYYDESTKKLKIDLTNTSGFQSVITGFLFNIDGNATASYSPADVPSTSGVDEGAFAFNTSFSGPFGTFDAGVFLQDLSEQQVKGIDEGETGQFVFDLSGPDAGSLSAIDFASQISDGAGSNDAYFLVRYQSVGANGADSDRAYGVPGEPTPIPLPAGAWMGISMLGLLGGTRFARKLGRKLRSV